MATAGRAAGQVIDGIKTAGPEFAEFLSPFGIASVTLKANPPSLDSAVLAHRMPSF